MTEPVQAILMVLESVFPPSGGGGAENQVHTLGGHMASSAEVRIIAPMVAYGPQIETEKLGALTLERIRYPKVQWLGAATLLLTLAWRLWRQRASYSVIHAHIAGNMATVCCLVGGVLGKPVIVKPTGLTEMVGGVLDPRAGLFARLRRAAMRGARFQATSSQIARMLVECGFDATKIHHIPNAVDMQRFSQRTAEGSKGNSVARGANGAGRVGVYVGRLAPEKGLELLVGGWARVSARAPDATLVLVGDGELMDSLQALGRRLGVAQSLRFAGATTEVERYLRQAHFAVLASSREGLSNSLLEYMAAGLPVVGTRISGTEDFIVHGENGWLFEPNDSDGLVQCLESALTVGDDRLIGMGAQARQRVTERASIEVVTRQLFDLYAASGRT